MEKFSESGKTACLCLMCGESNRSSFFHEMERCLKEESCNLFFFGRMKAHHVNGTIEHKDRWLYVWHSLCALTPENHTKLMWEIKQTSHVKGQKT